MIADLLRLPGLVALAAVLAQNALGAFAALHWSPLSAWALLFAARAVLDVWAIGRWLNHRDLSVLAVLLVDLAAGWWALAISRVEIGYFVAFGHPALTVLFGAQVLIRRLLGHRSTDEAPVRLIAPSAPRPRRVRARLVRMTRANP
jgi:hypothetical protein